MGSVTGDTLPLTRYELRIDVSEEVGIAGAEVAASVVAPIGALEPPVLAVAFPGGGYSKGYYDIQWPGGYSQAEYHASRGWAFAAVDHLGVGDSSLPDPSLLTLDVLAAANSAATAHIVATLRSRSSAEHTPTSTIEPFVLGVGQSMGGCVSIVAQATRHPFDALAVLGSSGSHTVLPHPDGDVLTPVSRGGTELDDVHVFAWSFHYHDIDIDIYQEDLRGGFPFRTQSVPPWGSATIPPVVPTMLAPAIVAEEAAAIDVPVFIGVGERDVCPDPWSEPMCYRSARQVGLCVVDRMGHMHNFASTREVLWDRLHRWGQSLI